MFKGLFRSKLGLSEEITIIHGGKKTKVMARIDTGATKSSIGEALAKELKLGPIVRKKYVRQVHGRTERGIIREKIVLAGKTILSEFTIADRAHMKYRVLIGQNTLKKGRFLIDPLR